MPKTQPRAGRDRFRDPEHKWMPDALPAWAEALADIDQSSAATRADTWRFWFPEPALLLGAQDADRLKRYVCNWVRIREPWLYAQRRRYVHLESPSLKAQHWREVLNISERTQKEAGSNNRSQQRKSDVLELLASTCGITDIDAFLASHPEWFSRDLWQTNDRDVRQLMWELFELGFRAELHQLDRYLRPLPAGSSEEKERERERELASVFPDANVLDRKYLPGMSDGLASPSAYEKATSLEALRKIMVQWPNPAVCLLEPDTERFKHSLPVFEAQIATCYTQAFFDAAGRPPILPHLYPSS